jgi:hypothetical protein
LLVCMTTIAAAFMMHWTDTSWWCQFQKRNGIWSKIHWWARKQPEHSLSLFFWILWMVAFCTDIPKTELNRQGFWSNIWHHKDLMEYYRKAKLILNRKNGKVLHWLQPWVYKMTILLCVSKFLKMRSSLPIKHFHTLWDSRRKLAVDLSSHNILCVLPQVQQVN